jgi:hypothetical protein
LTLRRSIRAARNTRPETPDALWNWVLAFTGVNVARGRVCRDHSPPFEWFSQQFFNPPPEVLIMGGRGVGKSFIEACLTHLESRFTPRLETSVLGGAKAQAMQTVQALKGAVLDGRGPGGSDRDTLERLLSDKAVYRNGSRVSILAASETSVRGPHVQRLRLDEVDEIDEELRESSLGMCMGLRGTEPSISMTSTWHRVAGPMTALMERADAGELPRYRTCTFDVLERCPESRSGAFVGGERCYELCPLCPLRPWCHSERDRNGDVPLAKLADGHYGISSLIQKARTASPRVFAADYLCTGPRPDGVWFKDFGGANVTTAAEYDPFRKVHASVDSGVFTGAVFFQCRLDPKADVYITVFADYLSENVAAESNARALMDLARVHCTGRLDRVSTDSAGGARNPIGPTVISEYERVGLRSRTGIDRWPVGPVADSLAQLEAMLGSAEGSVWLTIHPRCTALIASLQNYRRAKRGGQWQDYPEDPQHPHEDLVDALRGGLKVEFPEGRKPSSGLVSKPSSWSRY